VHKILIVGHSLSGKSTTVYYYLKWLLEKEENKGKKAIVVGMDGGSDEFWLSTDISNRLRIVNPFRFEIGLAVFRRICKGVWTDPQDMKPKVLDMSKYCAIAIDGWTGFATASLEKLRSDDNLPDSLATGKPLIVAGERFGSNSKPHYGVIHNEIKKLVDLELPRLGVPLISTALVDEGEERTTKMAKYGPKTCGSAIVADMPSWFADTFVQERFVAKVAIRDEKGEMTATKQEERFRLWFRAFEDKNTGIPYICGMRAIPEVREKVVGMWPKGWVEVRQGEGLERFYSVKEGKEEGK
jgi:GTPase SAR1 family protein